MGGAVINRALCFARICLVLVSLEILAMGAFIWRLSYDWKFVYPIIAVIANMQRWRVARNLTREISRTSEEMSTVRGRRPHTSLLGLWEVQSWQCGTAAMNVWYLVMLVEAGTHSVWVTRTLVGLTAIYVPIVCCSLCVFTAPLGQPRTAVKTFEHRSQVARASPQRTTAGCIICLANLDEGQMVGELPCGHAFHDLCIRRWLARKECCPLCEPGDGATGAAFAARDSLASVFPAGGEEAALATSVRRRPACCCCGLQRAARRAAAGCALALAGPRRGSGPVPEVVGGARSRAEPSPGS
mmetsp:Transcript_147996/g.412243  ORF Transcript_147996/g.412243 Transcript_147996/m.412243 type:complete len:299 (+) Transcript_147996:46-942(+)